MIWLEDRIDSWIEATTVNNVNNFKSATPYLSKGRFCACLKTVSLIVPVTDF